MPASPRDCISSSQRSTRTAAGPKYYPVRNDYSRHITFNDDAMVKVMDLLNEVAHARPPFAVVDQQTRSRAAQAVERGIQLVLKAQVRVSGQLTGLVRAAR